ncbi:hypothetical protein H4582DRAFT_1764142, partial [Lactarius indigo]
YTQLKQEYNIIKELRGLSGFGWDLNLNTVMAESDVWDTYIKVTKLVKKFCTKPFPLYNAVGELVDGTQATGKHAFQAGQASAFTTP